MNIQNLMQQAQKMQKKIMKLEEEFKQEVFTSESGGGVVKVQLSGEMKILDIQIADELMEKDEKDMLQDLITAAVNQGVVTVKRAKEAKMGKVVGKMGGGMPGLF